MGQVGPSRVRLGSLDGSERAVASARRRESWSIAGAILAELAATRAEPVPAGLTVLAERANISYGRLIEYLCAFEAQGLVTPGRPPLLTPAGIEFLREYEAWIQYLARSGFSESPPTVAIPAIPPDLQAPSGAGAP